MRKRAYFFGRFQAGSEHQNRYQAEKVSSCIALQYLRGIITRLEEKVQSLEFALRNRPVSLSIAPDPEKRSQCQLEEPRVDCMNDDKDVHCLLQEDLHTSDANEEIRPMRRRVSYSRSSFDEECAFSGMRETESDIQYYGYDFSSPTWSCFDHESFGRIVTSLVQAYREGELKEIAAKAVMVRTLDLHFADSLAACENARDLSGYMDMPEVKQYLETTQVGESPVTWLQTSFQQCVNFVRNEHPDTIQMMYAELLDDIDDAESNEEEHL